MYTAVPLPSTRRDCAKDSFLTNNSIIPNDTHFAFMQKNLTRIRKKQLNSNSNQKRKCGEYYSSFTSPAT
jgi:hypothetical protein